MKLRPTLLIVGAAVLAAGLGLGASVLMYGPGPLLSSPLGQWALRWNFAEDGHVAIGDPVTPFVLPTLAGGPLTIPSAGRPTLINYWASWCGPCREELPLLIAEAQARGDRLAFVPIALDTATEARGFVTAHPMPGAVPIEAPGPADSSVRLGNRAGVLPFSALVGADGRLVAVRIGAFRSRADLQAWLAQAPTGP